MWLARAKFSQIKRNFQLGVQDLNEGLVETPHFVPLLIEKAKLLLMLGEWDQMCEAAEKYFTCQKIVKFVFLFISCFYIFSVLISFLLSFFLYFIHSFFLSFFLTF